MDKKRKAFKLSKGCSVLIGGTIILCLGALGLSALQSVFTGKNLSPTLDANNIATIVFETALASNIETISFSSPTTIVPTTTSTTTFTDTQTSVPVIANTQAPISAPVTNATCIPNNSPQTGKVVDVIDGDTIKVLLDQDGLTYSVRYIGIDTPENTSKVEYFGVESTAKNIELVSGKTVTLIKDISETDQFGRLLRYVLAEDVL